MGAIYDTQPDGVFAISYKVNSLDEAVAGMAELGYEMLMRYEFGDIKEALFDTKKALGVYLEMIEYEGDDIQSADFEI